MNAVVGTVYLLFVEFRNRIEAILKSPIIIAKFKELMLWAANHINLQNWKQPVVVLDNHKKACGIMHITVVTIVADFFACN